MMRRVIVTAVGSAVLGGLGVGYLTLGPSATANRSSVNQVSLVDDTTDPTVVDPQSPPGAPDDDGYEARSGHRVAICVDCGVLACGRKPEDQLPSVGLDFFRRNLAPS